MLVFWFIVPVPPLFSEDAPAPEPLHIRNAFPPFLGLTPPSLAGARPGNGLGFHLTYASTHLVQRSPLWSFAVDQETAVLDFVFRRSFSRIFEFSLQLPVIAGQSGFLDGALEDYHELFGFPDYGRSLRPLNRFLYQIHREGEMILQGRSGMGLGDLGVHVKGRFPGTVGGMVVAGLAFVDLPTGDTGRGAGNGNVDGGAALILEASFSDRLSLVLNGGFFIPGDLDWMRRISLKPYGYGGADLAWQAFSKGTIHLQVFAQGSPYPETGIREIDDPSVILAVGGRLRLAKRLDLQFSFSEDPSTAGAPDFMVSGGLRVAL